MSGGQDWASEQIDQSRARQFRCPRCGGLAFGRIHPLTAPRLVQCHSDKHGNPVSGQPGSVTRPEDYCFWRGDESDCGLMSDKTD